MITGVTGLSEASKCEIAVRWICVFWVEYGVSEAAGQGGPTRQVTGSLTGRQTAHQRHAAHVQPMPETNGARLFVRTVLFKRTGFRLPQRMTDASSARETYTEQPHNEPESRCMSRLS
jgi:hypothetical protein